jgi:hypothetical protein
MAPMQFAPAGMNAHINYDLAPALVQTRENVDTAPDQGAHHEDFEKVNRTLAALEPQVRESFEQGVLLELDLQFAGIDNLVDGFIIAAAREAAWVNGEVLWRLRGEQCWRGPSWRPSIARWVSPDGCVWSCSRRRRDQDRSLSRCATAVALQAWIA